METFTLVLIILPPSRLLNETMISMTENSSLSSKP